MGLAGNGCQVCGWDANCSRALRTVLLMLKFGGNRMAVLKERAVTGQLQCRLILLPL